MGLDTSHDCWHGSYGNFSNWRVLICEVAGYGELRNRKGFGGSIPWPQGDSIVILLEHSDCDGEIDWFDCEDIANRLVECLPGVRIADKDRFNGKRWGEGYFTSKTEQFIGGLRDAANDKENVEFR